MATFTVTTLSDIVDSNDNLTSLREALLEAAVSAGADTIVFNNGASGEVKLSHAGGYGALVINSDVTINGDTNNDGKADITIDADRGGAGLAAADFHRAIEVTAGTSTLESLTITGGRVYGDGGGVHVASGATLTIEKSTITGNYASTIEYVAPGADARGAGIANFGTLTMRNSTVSENGSGSGEGRNAFGGGIFSNGTLTLENVTVADNSATGGQDDMVTGAGDGRGGGIAIGGGTATLSNVTITGNEGVSGSSAGGFPGMLGSGVNAGGVYVAAGTLNIANSIVLGNAANGTSVAESNIINGSGTVNYQGLNITGIGSDTNAGDGKIEVPNAALVFATTKDNSGLLKIAGVLADNGGPVQTVALKSDRYNPALDASSSSGTTNDARGTAKFDDTNIADRDGNTRDLGAFELGTATPANTAPTLAGDLATTVGVGGTVYISKFDLSFTDPDVLDTEANVTFTVSNLSRGVIKNYNDQVVTSFTAQEVRTGQIKFVHDGTYNASAGFDVSVEDGNEDGSAPVAQAFAIAVDLNDAPVLTGDLAVTVNEGGSYVLTSADLGFTDPDDTAAGVTFTASSFTSSHVGILVNGIFKTSFTGAELAAGQVKLTHNGTEPVNASFNIKVEDGNEDNSTPVRQTFFINIDPVNDAPVVTGDLTATVASGLTYTLTAADLGFTDPDDLAADVTFSVGASTNGKVYVNFNYQTYFTGADLASGKVQFVHSGQLSGSASFSFTLDDGNEDSSAPTARTFNLTFNINKPPVITGDLTASTKEGADYVLTTADIGVTDPDDTGAEITYTTRNATNGGLFVNGVAATTFTGADLSAGKAVFRHDGSETTAASFLFTADDGNEDASIPLEKTMSFGVTLVDDTAPTVVEPLVEISLGSRYWYTQDLTDMFADSETKLTLSATQADGSALPSWILLKDGVLWLTPFLDSHAGKFNVKVTATDEGGNTASDSFTVSMPAPPKLSNGATNKADTINGSKGNNTINAGGGNDAINAGSGKDIVYGGSGRDKILGGAGGDTLNGGSGNDILDGGNGRDRLQGDSGNDRLNGGKGSDLLWGSYASDTFIFDVRNNNKKMDFIADFISQGEGDKIQILTGKTLTKDNFVWGTAALDKDDYIIISNEGGRLEDSLFGDIKYNVTIAYDADGNGPGKAFYMFAISAQGIKGLSLTDFVL
jgi:hypothetical protein